MIIPIWLRKFIPESMKRKYRDTRVQIAWKLMDKGPIRIPKVWDKIYLFKKIKNDVNKNINTEMQWQSQTGQDYFVFHYIFQQKTNGIFVDIGANDPIIINNTYALEQRGWTGLAIEPQFQFQEKWKKERKSICLPVVLGGVNSAEVEFFESDTSTLSGIYGVAGKTKGKVSKRQQRTLGSILAEYNLTEVDFMSVDVEGYEMQVLSGIDWDKVDIHCIIIENQKSQKEQLELRKYMAYKDYIWYARLMWDDVFVKQDYLEFLKD